MPEHYTRNTETATAWCNKCQRMTTHRVDGVRRGPCLEHESPVKPPKKKKTESGNLFPIIALCFCASVAHAQAIPAGRAPSQTRILADAAIGTATGLGFKLPSLNFGLTVEEPINRRLEVQGAFKWSPDRKYITNDGNEAQAGAMALFWANRWLGITGQERFSRLWTSQFNKSVWAPSAGAVLRDRWYGSPGRAYFDYVFATGCQWATASNPCAIQSNRQSGIEFLQEFRLWPHWRIGIRGAWVRFADQSNQNRPDLGRIWQNTGTASVLIRYEFKAASIDDAY